MHTLVIPGSYAILIILVLFCPALLSGVSGGGSLWRTGSADDTTDTVFRLVRFYHRIFYYPRLVIAKVLHITSPRFNVIDALNSLGSCPGNASKWLDVVISSIYLRYSCGNCYCSLPSLWSRWCFLTGFQPNETRTLSLSKLSMCLSAQWHLSGMETVTQRAHRRYDVQQCRRSWYRQNA